MCITSKLKNENYIFDMDVEAHATTMVRGHVETESRFYLYRNIVIWIILHIQTGILVYNRK